jgi:hypothetical protein
MSSVAVADRETTTISEVSTERWVRWRSSAAIALGVRAAFIAVAVIATWFLSRSEGTPGTGIFDMWRRWDAHHFLTIAEYGYTAPESDAHAAAFFPLFPLTVRALLVFGLSPTVAGMLVAFAASVVAGVYLYRLAEEELGDGSGARAVLYMFLFPTAVFLVAPYSEPLFLAGAIPAFYYARRQRWHLVGIPAAVAMGARAAGVFLLVGLLAEFVRQRDFSTERMANAGVAFLVGLLPLLAYGAFLSQAMGDPFEFLAAQREGWGRRFVGPLTSFTTTWGTWNEGHATNWLMAWRVEIAAAAAGVAFTIWAALKREWGYAAYMTCLLGVLMTSSWYYSIPRMLLSMFPIFLLLASATRHRPSLHDGILIVLAPLAGLGVVVFTQGNWFY